MINRNNKQRGSSLVEMLVALFVLAVGMLGVLSMQVKSMQFSQTAYYYSQAVYLANEILESIRSNPQSADTYLIDLDDVTPTANVDCQAVECDAQQMRDWNLNQWRSNIDQLLVSGRSSIEKDGDYFRITVQFDDSTGASVDTADAMINEYVLVTEFN